MTEIPFPLVPEENASYLSEKQRIDYKNQRRDFVEWLLGVGKDPSAADGYSKASVKRTAYRCGKWDRYIWEKEDGYTYPLIHDHADAYMKHLAYEDYTNSHRANTLDALKRYFKWLNFERGGDLYDPDLSFSKNGSVQPPDFLSIAERQAIREAALDYGSIPAYNGLGPDEREHWKRHVAQMLRKPVEDVVPADWDRVNGWKFTSLVWTSLDTGLRPIEVGRAKTSWIDVQNQLLRIPAEESSKNTDNWMVSVSERTADALDRWLEERQRYERYDETDALWLTREGNPYGPQSLRRLLLRLCDRADIQTQSRKMSWYSIRHSVGTYMTREEDLAAAKAQLRHQSVQTTVKYDAVPVEDRREALDRMG